MKCCVMRSRKEEFKERSRGTDKEMSKRQCVTASKIETIDGVHDLPRRLDLLDSRLQLAQIRLHVLQCRVQQIQGRIVVLRLFLRLCLQRIVLCLHQIEHCLHFSRRNGRGPIVNQRHRLRGFVSSVENAVKSTESNYVRRKNGAEVESK